jgi:hypothetical protein
LVLGSHHTSISMNKKPTKPKVSKPFIVWTGVGKKRKGHMTVGNCDIYFK